MGDTIKIHLAEHLGFCFGVNRAISKVENLLDKEESIYVDGQVIHNPEETTRLENKGLKLLDQSINKNDFLVLRSHGTPKEKKEKLQKEYTVVDTVCPYVKKVHLLSEKHKEDNLIIFGKKDHPEVKGINSYSNYNGYIVENREELLNLIDFIKFNGKENFIVSQTTLKKETAMEYLKILKDNEVNFEYYDTICDATKNRADAVKELAKNVDVVIVLGDKKSSNWSNNILIFSGS